MTQYLKSKQVKIAQAWLIQVGKFTVGRTCLLLYGLRWVCPKVRSISDGICYVIHDVQKISPIQPGAFLSS